MLPERDSSGLPVSSDVVVISVVSGDVVVTCSDVDMGEVIGFEVSDNLQDTLFVLFLSPFSI